jgi:hypothetical protein
MPNLGNSTPQSIADSIKISAKRLTPGPAKSGLAKIR